MLLNLLFLPVSFLQFIPATHKDTMELIYFIRAVETNQTVSCLLAKNILSPSLKRTGNGRFERITPGFFSSINFLSAIQNTALRFIITLYNHA